MKLIRFCVKGFRGYNEKTCIALNDLTAIITGADPNLVMYDFIQNLSQILHKLVVELGAEVYISNLYTISDIPGADDVIPVFNQIVVGVANSYGVPVADFYTEFEKQKGLLLIDRHGASPLEIHPTNAGHKAMAVAFKSVVN